MVAGNAQEIRARLRWVQSVLGSAKSAARMVLSSRQAVSARNVMERAVPSGGAIMLRAIERTTAGVPESVIGEIERQLLRPTEATAPAVAKESLYF